MLSRTVSSKLVFEGSLRDRFPGSDNEDARHCVSSVIPLGVEVWVLSSLQGDTGYNIESKSQRVFFECEEIALLGHLLE
jgi:hypothetical protein